MRSQSKRQDSTAEPTILDAATPDSVGSPGQSIERRRVSKAQYLKKAKIRLAVNLLLAVLPFALVLSALALMSVGFFRYVEQESVLSILLDEREKDSTNLHGAGWNQATQVTSQTSETVQQVAIEKEGRLIVPFFYIGDQFGTIRIPSVKIEVKAFQGDSEKEFRKGAGHYTGSYFPGQDGNILIAGHRTSYFRNFEYLKINDLVYFDTNYGSFTYQVRAFKIINGDDASVAAATDKEQLTMYTCYPFTFIGNAPRRYVVICDLIEKTVRT